MRFYKKITDLVIVDNPFIKVYTNLPDQTKLYDEIQNFKEEIDWPEMWDIEEAKKRLKNGWILVTLEFNNFIKGWFWFDVNYSQAHNLYVNKNYRNMGYASLLYQKIDEFAYKNNIKIIYGEIEDWNLKSIDLILKMGWEKLDD